MLEDVNKFSCLAMVILCVVITSMVWTMLEIWKSYAKDEDSTIFGYNFKSNNGLFAYLISIGCLIAVVALVVYSIYKYTTRPDEAEAFISSYSNGSAGEGYPGGLLSPQMIQKGMEKGMALKKKFGRGLIKAGTRIAPPPPPYNQLG